MTIEELKTKKTTLGLTNEMIAASAGIPLSTVQKIMSGATKAPRKSTLVAIETVLSAEERRRSNMSGIIPDRRKSYTYEDLPETCGTVMEPAAGYNLAPEKTPKKKKKDGEYTLDDYYALPDERRVELIDGVIYDMASPTGFHQIIAGHLYSILLTAIQAKKGSCMPFMSPIDVRLDLDDRTMVQPDVIILCDKSKYTPRRIEGAPDFIAEVLSPSSKTRDLFIKLNKYRNAGVREYWVIDPIKKSVMTYVFENQDDYADYTFRDHIPVSIYGDELVIDFSRIDDVVSEWM